MRVRPPGSDVMFEAEGETEMLPDPKGFETGAASLVSPRGRKRAVHTRMSGSAAVH